MKAWIRGELKSQLETLREEFFFLGYTPTKGLAIQIMQEPHSRCHRAKRKEKTPRPTVLMMLGAGISQKSDDITDLMALMYADIGGCECKKPMKTRHDGLEEHEMPMLDNFRYDYTPYDEFGKKVRNWYNFLNISKGSVCRPYAVHSK